MWCIPAEVGSQADLRLRFELKQEAAYRRLELIKVTFLADGVDKGSDGFQKSVGSELHE